MWTEALWGRFSGQKLLWEGSFEGRSILGRLLLGEKVFGKLFPKSEIPWGGFFRGGGTLGGLLSGTKALLGRLPVGKTPLAVASFEGRGTLGRVLGGQKDLWGGFCEGRSTLGKVFGAEAPLGGFVRGQKHFGEATVRTEALWEAPSEVRSTLGRV